jgi:hypothetical protein
MKRHRIAISMVCLFCGLAAPSATAAITAVHKDDQVRVWADHFQLTIDGKRGGQITDVALFDGSRWNRMIGGDSQSCPAVKISDSSREYILDKVGKTEIRDVEVLPDVVRLVTKAVPFSADGQPGPWTVQLRYEIYAEGAVFIDLQLALPKGKTVLRRAEISLTVDQYIFGAAKYRQQTYTHKQLSSGFKGKGLPTARIAFGVNPLRSYTNEVQAVVEDPKGIGGEADFTSGKGQFTWLLANKETPVEGPFVYNNRFALGLGSAAVGKPKTNVIAQRVYHWINWVKYHQVAGGEFYPTDAQIDKMAAHGATMLILHQHWMSEGGLNGKPHANYIPRDADTFQHVIDYAHQKGLRMGVYSRGIERYTPATGFFQKYLKRNWDGLYVDWSSAFNISNHENRTPVPEALLGDAHFSPDGLYTPAREWFLYCKKLRDLVGPKGFIINHQGFGTAGILANFAVDAYLPGESPLDHKMFKNVDDAVYQGMLGGVVCMPWTIDAPDYITPEGIAKMAAWGFYPHTCLAFQRPAVGKKTAGRIFPADPDNPAQAYALPCWRVLSAVDAERCTLYNSPAVNVIAATTSNPNVPCLVYKQAGQGDCPDFCASKNGTVPLVGSDKWPKDTVFLVVAANLSDKTASATITLKPEVLGMAGEYQVSRISSETGKAAPAGTASDMVKTSELAPWQIEGLKLTKKTSE